MANTSKKKNLMKFPSIFKSRAGQPWQTTAFDSSLFTNSSESLSATNTTATEMELTDGEESLETVVRGARSERLFFEPDDTSSILEKSKPIEPIESEALLLGFKESLIVSIETENPYEDFRKSMGEMVESHGVKDWDGLEELLGWYLKANWKNNHRFIFGAFVDLLIDVLHASSCSSLSSNSDSNYYTCTESSSSSCSSSCSCASTLRSLDRSSIPKELDEEDDDHITETV
ncbi:Transcription repressor OFP13, partial [Cucurbita argyrosperma subsp. argyrosperma]